MAFEGQDPLMGANTEAPFECEYGIKDPFIQRAHAVATDRAGNRNRSPEVILGNGKVGTSMLKMEPYMKNRNLAVTTAVLCLCCGVVLWGAIGQDRQGLLSYAVDPAWPKRPADVAWGETCGVALDARDRVWVFTRSASAVQVYESDGTFVRDWRDTGIAKAHGLKIDPEGNVWLSDIELHVVRKYSPEGELLLTLGTPGKPGEDGRHFFKPTDMVVAPNGDIYVADGYGNSRVARFSRDGQFIRAWGKRGDGPGEFSAPHSIVIDSKGRIYVADRTNVRVQVFDLEGKYLTEWRHVVLPWGLWITPQDEIWICGSTPMTEKAANGQVGFPPKDQVFMKFDTSGRLLRLWNVPKGQGPGQLDWVHAIAVDSKENIFAVDIQGKRVQKFVRQR